MKFDEFINKVLKENDTSKEDKLSALKAIKSIHSPNLNSWENYKDELTKLKSLSSPEFPKATPEQLRNNDQIYGYSVVNVGNRGTDRVVYMVFYEHNGIEVFNDEDAEIENWNIVLILADLSEIAKEPYFVFITEDNAPSLYSTTSGNAWRRVVDDYETGMALCDRKDINLFWEDLRKYTKE